MTRKTAARPARKRCDKCGAVGYHATRARRCRRIERRMGARFYCYGNLRPAPIARERKPGPTRAQQLERDHARAMKMHAAAIRREKLAQTSRRKWWQKIRRLERAIADARQAEQLARADQATRAYFSE